MSAGYDLVELNQHLETTRATSVAVALEVLEFILEDQIQEAICLLNSFVRGDKHKYSNIREKDEILYRLARLARNTDGIHPSTWGVKVGHTLLELRLIDGERYDKEVIGDGPRPQTNDS